MITTRYNVEKGKNKNIAVVSDIHCLDCGVVCEILKREGPDMILVPGDLGSKHICGNVAREGIYYEEPQTLIEFFECARNIAPVFLSRGNNDMSWDAWDFAKLVHMGVNVLENNWVKYDDMYIGGLVPSSNRFRKHKVVPDIKWLEIFGNLDGMKILLCHQPELYDRYIRNYDIDLIVSGHAHGGQIRIGKQGLYARGQGFFPKYTAGVFEDRLVVSRGVGDNSFIPRINNKPEVVILSI